LHDITLERKQIGPNQKRKKAQRRVRGLEKLGSTVAHFFVSLLFFLAFFYPYYSNFARMEDML
jgi:hypothetical protein